MGFLPSPFPSGSVAKSPPTNAGDRRDMDSIPGSGRSPGEGNGNSLKYSYLGNSMGRGPGWAIAHGVSKNCATVKLSMNSLHGNSK